MFALAGIALVFLGASGRLPASASAVLALGAPLAALMAISWRTRWRGAAVAAAGLVVLLALWHANELASRAPTLWLAQHMAVYLLLAAYFGTSLLPAREPVATRIARAVLPAVSPAVSRYSRRVTQLWAGYFMAVAIASAIIHFTARDDWAIFAIVTSGPMVALLFALEFAVRRMVLPARDCASIAETVRGFRALWRTGAPSEAGPHG
jgi:uncharacterized membrane protein